MSEREATLDVANQASDLSDYDAFAGDAVLKGAVSAFGGAWAEDQLARTGATVGARATQALARQANRCPPELVTHDRFGTRIDAVELHPAWHELMAAAFASGAHSLAWTAPRRGAHVARAALSYLWNQAENGVCCPLGMTFASVATLRHAPDLAAHWEQRILANDYDPRPIPGEDKRAVVVAMALTERQGGSDLRRTETVARPADGRSEPGATYLINGHKWFFSVPQADLVLTLAQTERGLSCFCARGFLPDGSRNGFRLQRLKDKCGNRSNASSEVEFVDLEAMLVGEEGRGIAAILEMAHLTRLECAVSSSGLMRQALSQALHHVSGRTAFQKRLIDQPLMRAVVADMALDNEAATLMALRLAATLDRSDDAHERRLSRIAIPVAKYWICKRAPALVAEALECHGGNGFIEDHLLARLYREAPLNGIWEGSGNVICLDIARAAARSPDTVDAFLHEVRLASGEPALDRLADELEPVLRSLPSREGAARWAAEAMALALAASLLLRHAPASVAQSFVAARLARGGGSQYGSAADTLAADEILERARIH